ncbi:MAG: hypothetical protein WC120_00120 [Parcubacteria group bacterium]
MPSEQQQAHADNLNAARGGSLKKSAQNIRKNVKAAANIVSLMSHIEPFTDWLFGIALIFAIIKDIIDLASTALIAIGGVGIALIFITTAICSLFIFFIMLLTGSSGKRKILQGLTKRFGILALATIMECLPAIDTLPLETISIIIIIWMTLVERKRDAETQKERSSAMATAA